MSKYSGVSASRQYAVSHRGSRDTDDAQPVINEMSSAGTRYCSLIRLACKAT